ncbi:hypothetical protein LDENG_00042520 [Lucifuga dentata]|nr:hypothetical protein LDENG_00042520 [Lucifuga dentata]
MDVAEDSVDDMFNGCRAEMMQKLLTKYKDEIKNSEACANRNVRNRQDVDQALTKEHMQAICVYTSDYAMFHETFNDAVRHGREQYSTSFPFHSYQFLLTIAVQFLKENQEGCHKTFRRSNDVFTGEVSKIIRFGSFASSSFLTEMSAFGDKTCFKIKTCYGASLKRYSYFEEEEEVLIPPYELFKIKKVKSIPGLDNCKVIYVLKSAGVLSDLNCKATGHPAPFQKEKGFFNLWKFS